MELQPTVPHARIQIDSSKEGSCGCKDGFYLLGNQCLACHPSCSTCSGGGDNECLSCDNRKERFLSETSCLGCHSSCLTCSGGSSSNCSSCFPGTFLRSSSCVSCLQESSKDCSVETKIEVPFEITELTQNFSIKLTPSLRSQLPSSVFESVTISPNKFLKDHFKLIFKNKNSTPTELTILEQQFDKSEPGSTTLLITFLQKLRSKHSEFIRVTVVNPLIYSATEENSNQPAVYLKSGWSQAIAIVERKNSDEETSVESAKRFGTAVSIGIAATSTTALALTAVFGSTGTSATYLIKLFNIMDIVSSLGNLNVQFGSRIKIVLSFIDSIQIPEIGFLGQLSPIKDSEAGSPDSSAYYTLIRGSRPKIVAGNGDVFIARGQNFVFSTLIVGLFAFIFILEQFLEKNNKFLKILSYAFFMLIGIFFFDYQAISMGEVAFFDYKKRKHAEFKFTLSLIFSAMVILILVSEFLTAWNLILRLKYKGQKNQQKEQKKDKVEQNDEIDSMTLTPREQMIFEKYTEVLVLYDSKDQKFHPLFVVLFENIRFFVIQIVIITLQHLNRTQSFVVFLLNLTYFVYFICVLQASKVFISRLYIVKEIVQEICIMTLISTITLFSFTEKTNFKDSVVYTLIEWVAIISMAGACGAELITLVSELLNQFGVLAKNLLKVCRKSKVQNRDSENEKKFVPKNRNEITGIENKMMVRSQGSSGGDDDWGPSPQGDNQINEKENELDLKLEIECRKKQGLGEYLDTEKALLKGDEDSNLGGNSLRKELDRVKHQQKKNKKIVAFTKFKKK